MARTPRTIEISNMPELLRIVEEVRTSKTPRVLSRRKKPLAILRPLESTPKNARSRKSKADEKAFLSSAGGWRDLVDTEKLKEDIDASRRILSA
jgi:hypothetical protein